MRYENETINKLLDDNKITEREYSNLFVDDVEKYILIHYSTSLMLFETKERREKENNVKFNDDFLSSLSKIITLQEEETLDLSYIKFQECNFIRFLELNKINQEIDFTSAHFKEKISFEGIKFLERVTFTHAIFEDDVNLNYTSFKKEADFSNIIVNRNASFKQSNFQDTVTFENSRCKEFFDMSDTSFFYLNLDNAFFSKTSYLRIHGWDNEVYEDIGLEPISSKHIATKETARIIKVHFEQKKNSSEANTFFAIEMDKNRDELEDYADNPFFSFFTNQDYFVLTVNKYISDFGTNWIRPLLVMFMFGFLSAFVYALIEIPKDMDSSNILLQSKDVLFLTFTGFIFSLLGYLLHIFREIILFIIVIILSIIILFLSPELRSINNDISKLINPLNIFKGKDYFDHIAPYGMLVKLIMSVLIYQFIMAFRQKMRRG